MCMLCFCVHDAVKVLFGDNWGYMFFGAYSFGCTHFFIIWRIFIMDAYILGVIIGAIFSGALVGAVPAICGAIKHKIGLAIGGFFACLVAGLILGLILSIPTCAVFMFLIFRKPKVNNKNEEAEDTSTEK